MHEDKSKQVDTSSGLFIMEKAQHNQRRTSGISDRYISSRDEKGYDENGLSIVRSGDNKMMKDLSYYTSEANADADADKEHWDGLYIVYFSIQRYLSKFKTDCTRASLVAWYIQIGSPYLIDGLDAILEELCERGAIIVEERMEEDGRIIIIYHLG